MKEKFVTKFRQVAQNQLENEIFSYTKSQLKISLNIGK